MQAFKFKLQSHGLGLVTSVPFLSTWLNAVSFPADTLRMHSHEEALQLSEKRTESSPNGMSSADRPTDTPNVGR